MSTTSCYFDNNGCFVCPPIAAVPAVPATVKVDAQLGWNAGGDSVSTLSGDVHVVFNIAAPVAGAVVGLKTSRVLPDAIALIEKGFYVFSVGASSFVAPIEFGVQLMAAVAYTLGDTLEIRRVAGKVTYRANGVLLAASSTKLYANVIVNACLYAAGDTVP